MAVKYRLDFDTTTGADINWRLDILQDGYSGAVLPVKSDSTPITIAYDRTYDAYTPIIASTATVNLVVDADTSYDDFSAGAFGEYEVILRYQQPVGEGARVEDAGGTALTFAAETGTRIADRFSSGQISVRISGGDKATTVPVLDSSNEGRWVYVSNDGGATVVPIGTLRATEYTSATRIQLFDTKGYGSDAALDAALSGYAVGDEIWLAGEGDTGTSTSFTGAGDYVDYWCGLVVKESYSEHISSFPYNVSFRATDGLGRLSQDIVDELTSEDDVTLLRLIQESLQQIPLPLSLRTFTGIESGGADVLDTTVSRYAFYGSGNRPSHLDRLKDILAGANLTVFQSNANWYVINNSSYAGTISSGVEDITFKVYNSQGIAQSDVSVNVLRDTTGTDIADLRVANNSLHSDLRDPYGSIECHVNNITAKALNQNPAFVLSGTGWQSLGVPLAFSTTVFNTGGRSITTGVTATSDETSASDGWFKSVDLTEWTRTAPLEVSFDYYFDFTNNAVVDGEVRFRIVIEIDDDSGGTIFSNIDKYVWDFNSSIWHGLDLDNNKGRDEYHTDFIGRASSGDEGSWKSFSVNTNTTIFQRGTNPRLSIEFLSPIALNNSEAVISNGSGLMTTYLDNVSMAYRVNTDDQVFELVDDALVNTKEYEYTTSISSLASDVLYNDLSVNDFNRVGITETLSLERLNLQQKLNDFRNFAKYYRGTLINQSNTPFAMEHKLLVNFPTKSETITAITQNISINPKSNQFTYLGRIPNQATDVASTFHDTDVALTAPSLEKADGVEYTLNVVLDIDNESGTDISSQFNWDLGSGDNTSHIFRGSPGTTQTATLFIKPPTGQQGVINDFSVSDTTLNPTPGAISAGAFNRLSTGDLGLPITVEFPRRPDAGTLHITGDTIPFELDVANEITSAISMDLSFTGSGGATGGISTSTPITKNVSGVGASATDVVFEIDAGNGNLILTADQDGVHGIAGLSTSPVITGLGTQVARLTYSYVRPNSSPSVVQNIDVNGTYSTVAAFELNGITKNLLITNANNDVSINDGTTSGNVTTIPFHGFDGDVIYRGLSLVPNSDKLITGVTNSYLTPSTITSAGAIVESSENWEVPIFFELDGTSSVSTTINISTADEPYSVTCPILAIGQNFVVEGATLGDTIQEFVFTFDDGDLGGDINGTFYLRPVDGYMWNSSQSTPEVLIDINEMAGGFYTNASGSTTQIFAENDWTGTVQTTLDPNGRLQIALVGKLPLTSGNFVLPIQVAGNPANGGGATTLSPATTATVTALGPNIPAYGGSALFEVEKNGAVDYSIEVTTDTTAGDDTAVTTNTSGSFLENVNVPGGSGVSLTLQFSGTYAPITGESGSSEVRLSANEIPLRSAVGSTGDPIILYSTMVRYTLRVHPKGSTSIIASGFVDQLASLGGRTVTIQTTSATTDAQITTAGNFISSVLPTWTFNF